ncbi:hypothetical protein GCM10007940_02620 [Portibacter lacus]|uniref:SusD/RagB family nutrient-binding outer membrane lipoprotein n=2 Tax=Portibacter lacus TaxID=1099794 RepID=A0AA37SKS4_9BACT|nr:hypothetical protein GCM10007940_02620 [Portibacter lacus]
MLFASCESFLDVNTDPNRVTDVTLNSLLPTTIEAASAAHYRSAYTTNQITQHLGSYFGYPQILSLSSTWSGIYLKGLNNLDQLIIKAEESNSPHYAGIGKVLSAINVGLLTDNWEAAPYSEAILGSDNFTPKFDSQEQLYASINSLLDAAITDLQKSESIFAPGSDDLAYNGDISKWIKLAYTLKARYAIHLTNKNGTQAASDALSAISNGFTSNGDDFQLMYNSVNKNPWHTSVALANNTGNLTITQGSYFVDLLKGITDEGDPRMAALVDAGDIPNAEVVGITSYDDNAAPNNSDLSETTWHSTESAPIVMVSYAEAKFIEAEAAFISNDKTRAYDAYLEGIAANVSKLEVEAGDFLTHPNVAVGADNLTLSDIMEQKYIALYLNPEAWVDMRRYNYSTDAYTGFVEADPFELGGSFQRVRYPDDEFNRNGDETQANNKDLLVQMWRDQ